jgi:Mrp family chromosome partitioning ATPase
LYRRTVSGTTTSNRQQYHPSVTGWIQDELANMPKVISIHSYRGGTGKSNFTANLAATVAQFGNRVGIVDTDLPSPGIHNLFDLEPEHIHKTLNHYLWGAFLLLIRSMTLAPMCKSAGQASYI